MASRQEYGLIAVIILGLLGTGVHGVGALRLCGRQLADALALVCQARGGYNQAFSGVAKGGRYKRGIVDECCRGGCSLPTLESYCSEPRPNRKDTIQISKRSELSSSEIRTPTPVERPDGKPIDNYITKNKRLRPLALLYSDRQMINNHNADINSVNNRKKSRGNVRNDPIESGGIIWSGYSADNEPLDTSEIMAEVARTSIESLHRTQRNFKNTN